MREWIEINMTNTDRIKRLVSLYMREWIEISYGKLVIIEDTSLSLYERVD